ncbi:MAG TPA: copper-binding protein [Rhodocyclaceae bacterium]|jgi:Cu/Ag efflux protein CusF
MKTLIASSLIALAAVSASSPTLAADKMDGMNHMDHGAMQTQGTAEATLVDGLVKKVDKTTGKITLTHGPLPNGMPGMTMAFKVKETAMLDQVKEGQKVRFAINDAMVVIRLEAAK